MCVHSYQFLVNTHKFTLWTGKVLMKSCERIACHTMLSIGVIYMEMWIILLPYLN